MSTLIGTGKDGSGEDLIFIREHDPAWPEKFAVEKQLLSQALGTLAAEIHHIGSTALPGLGAKDCIDIMVAVDQLHAAQTYAGAMEKLGYIHEPIADSDRLFFRRKTLRSHHVHVVELDGWHYWRWLLFKEYLLTHAEAAISYVRLKHQLVSEVAGNREAYTRAKTGFVKEIERQAFHTHPDLEERFRNFLLN